MDDRIARSLSFLFHPLLIPTYILLTLLNLDRMYTVLLTWQLNLFIIGTVLVTTFIFPLLVIFIMYRIKLISSLYLPQRQERIFPLITIAIFYYLTFYLMKQLYLPVCFQIFLLGASVIAIISLITMFFFRISLHMTALGAASGLFLSMTVISGGAGLFLLIISVIISGMVGSARLKLNAHQPAEIYSGWLMGAVVICLTCLLLF